MDELYSGKPHLVGVTCGVGGVLGVALGDCGEGDEPTQGDLVKQSDETYLIWCSGRIHCSGLLIHMQVGGAELKGGMAERYWEWTDQK